MGLLANFDLIRLLTSFGLFNATTERFNPDPYVVAAKTTSYTILPTDICGTLFTNRGASGAVTFTLPAPTAVKAGTWYQFLGIAAQNIIIATATADTLLTLNDAAADSIATSTSGQIIGALTKVINDGTQWIAVGETVGVTYTVVTA